MHVQLANVIRNISGVTGLAMVRALLAGARNPAPVAALQAYRSKASTHTLANSLEGNWRDELRFKLRQSLERSACYQRKSAACDPQIEAHLLTFDRTIEVSAPPAAHRQASASESSPQRAAR